MDLLKTIKFEINYIRLKRMINMYDFFTRMGYNPNPYLLGTIKNMYQPRKRDLADKTKDRFVLSIPIAYWQSAHPEWPSLSEQEKKAIKAAKVKEISNALINIDHASFTSTSELFYDQSWMEISGLKIEKITSLINS